jgi:hypothetical protein
MQLKWVRVTLKSRWRAPCGSDELRRAARPPKALGLAAPARAEQFTGQSLMNRGTDHRRPPIQILAGPHALIQKCGRTE